MGGKTSQSTQTVQIPPEVLARYNAVNQRAESTAGTPFERYSNDPSAFVAQLGETQKRGISNVNQAYGTADPYFTQAGFYGRDAAVSVNPEALGPEQINKYLNPYMGTVLSSTEAMLNQQNQQAMAGQTGNAIRSGAFGGDRAGIAAGNLQQQQNLAAGKIYSDIASQGYNQALQTAAQQQGLNYQSEAANRAAKLAASQNLANLGTGAQAAKLQGAQAQLGAGQLEQQTEQAGKTALFNQFQQEKSYPFQVAQFLANIAEGTGALSGSTTTTVQPGGLFASDRRLKEDIHVIGKTFDGQPIYKYRYKGDPKHQIGLIAQEVEKSHPHAVGLAGGYKAVDYDKATKDAEHKGHFASGGLVPESMGGHVAPEHMGERYASGGYPTLQGLSSSDMAAILEAQSKMFGPFSSYGMDISGNPHGGTEGYVPAANLPVASLATASGGLDSYESGLQQAASAADTVGSLARTYETGKKAYEDYKTKKDKEEKGTHPTESSGGLIGYAFGGDVHEDKIDIPKEETPKPAIPEVGSSAAPASAAKAPNEGQAKMDIPNQQGSAPQLQVPQMSAGKDTTGQDLQAVAAVASAIAMMCMSDKRLKEDINPIGKTFDGQTVYKYRFKGDPKFQIGLLAQEVEGHHPHAVGLIGGYKGVDYDKATEDAEHRGHFSNGGLTSSPLLFGLMSEGLASGGMPYGGGMPYDKSSGSSGLNIPTQSNQSHKLITAGSLPTQKSGLGQLAELATAADAGMNTYRAATAPSSTPSTSTSSTSTTTGGMGGNDLGDVDFSRTSSTEELPTVDMSSFGMARGGLAGGRHGYALDGTVDDIGFPEGYSRGFLEEQRVRAADRAGQAAHQKIEDQYGQFRNQEINKGLTFGMPKSDGSIGQFTSNQYVDAQGRPNLGFVETRQPTEQGRALENQLTFSDESGRRYTFDQATGQRHYVSNTPSTTVTHPATHTVTNRRAGLNAGTPVYEGAPIAEALGDVSQMPTKTAVGATGTGGLSGIDQPATAPAAATAPASAPVAPAAPAAGLAGGKTAPVTKPETKSGENSHWYTDPKYLVPLLQGVAAMGTAPTQHFGTALAAGLGQGLKGYQQQRQFELDKQLEQAQTKEVGANTYNQLLDALSKSIISDAQGHPMGVLTARGQLVNYMDYYNTPPELRDPLATQAAVLDFQMNVLHNTQIPKYQTTAQPSVPEVTAPQSTYEYTPDDQAAIDAGIKAKYRSPTSFEESSKARNKAQEDLQSGYDASISNAPQIYRLTELIANEPDTVLSGSTLGSLLMSPMNVFNNIVKAGGRADLQILPQELGTKIVADKLAAGQQLALASESGQNSYNALNQYASAARPLMTGIPREAALDLLSSNIIDNQRNIDAYDFNRSAQMNSKQGALYDPYVAINRFNTKHSADVIAKEKEAVKDILNDKYFFNSIKNNSGNPAELKKIDAYYKKRFGVDNVTRFFTTKKVQ